VELFIYVIIFIIIMMEVDKKWTEGADENDEGVID
jgi:hypothetical protein